MTLAPDLIAPVVGFRKWRVVADHITSPYVPLRWNERETRARCMPANRSLMFGAGWLEEPHEAPHPRCKCGVYAWHDPPQRGPIRDAQQSFGVIALWGRVEVHEEGMRGEYARIEALSFQPDLGSEHVRRIKAIADRLRVAAVAYDDLPRAAQEFGDGVPAALRPPSRQG